MYFCIFTVPDKTLATYRPENDEPDVSTVIPSSSISSSQQSSLLVSPPTFYGLQSHITTPTGSTIHNSTFDNGMSAAPPAGQINLSQGYGPSPYFADYASGSNSSALGHQYAHHSNFHNTRQQWTDSSSDDILRILNTIHDRQLGEFQAKLTLLCISIHGIYDFAGLERALTTAVAEIKEDLKELLRRSNTNATLEKFNPPVAIPLADITHLNVLDEWAKDNTDSMVRIIDY